MSDELDQAAELEELERNIALANRKHPEMTFTGTCYYCEEAVSHLTDAICMDGSIAVVGQATASVFAGRVIDAISAGKIPHITLK